MKANPKATAKKKKLSRTTPAGEVGSKSKTYRVLSTDNKLDFKTHQEYL